MPLTMRRLMASPLAKRAALVLLLGLLLGFAGPFGGNPPLSPPVRYAFWFGMVVVGFGAALAVERLIPATSAPRPLLRLVAVAIASALPVTFVAAWVIPLIRPGHHYDAFQLPALFSAVAVVQLVIVVTLLRPTSARAREPLPATGPSPHPLLSRLPSRLGREILALEGEDHYVRVHTPMGSDLVLMRLSDAVAAMGPDAGLQVHRSWWVAQGAIGEVVRSGQRSHVRLTNGLLAPVGPSYAATVRALAARLAASPASLAPPRSPAPRDRP